MTSERSTPTLPVRSSGELTSDGRPPSPYLAAGNLRANAYLDLARTLTNYRVLAALLLLVDLVLVGALVWHSTRTRIVPYVVELDSAGDTVAVGPADRLPEPDKALRVHEIARWLRNVRTVTLDRDVQRRMILDAYAYSDGRAVTLLNRWYRRRTPFARADRGTVSVQVTSVLALSQRDRTWQVQWRETDRDLSGDVRTRERWQAVLTLHVDPPDRVEQVVTNPLGIHVVDFDWTRLPDLPEDEKGTRP